MLYRAGQQSWRSARVSESPSAEIAASTRRRIYQWTLHNASAWSAAFDALMISSVN
ncbi:hypothetical protein [Granulicella sp. S156]|uniref:hypothetical protein n=1 Tax=Granulicella sp. S156 TaxID=1747224 RepID=UPI00131E0185|nr:hypothetical protein [Granulicella sp. S156]